MPEQVLSGPTRRHPWRRVFPRRAAHPPATTTTRSPPTDLWGRRAPVAGRRVEARSRRRDLEEGRQRGPSCRQGTTGPDSASLPVPLASFLNSSRHTSAAACGNGRPRSHSSSRRPSLLHLDIDDLRALSKMPIGTRTPLFTSTVPMSLGFVVGWVAITRSSSASGSESFVRGSRGSRAHRLCWCTSAALQPPISRRRRCPIREGLGWSRHSARSRPGGRRFPFFFRVLFHRIVDQAR